MTTDHIATRTVAGRTLYVHADTSSIPSPEGTCEESYGGAWLIQWYGEEPAAAPNRKQAVETATEITEETLRLTERDGTHEVTLHTIDGREGDLIWFSVVERDPERLVNVI